MNITTISNLLIPCLPFLLKKVGESALGSAASQMGKDAWEQAQKIWAKLQPKIEVEATAKAAAEELAKKPESDIWKAAFQEKLTEILENDPELKAAIAEILKDTNADGGQTQVQQTIGTMAGGQAINQMENSEAKSIDSIGSVGRDVNL